MADDDFLFEKALARQLRQRGAENGESTSAERVEGRHQDCPDAEALAAYHERTLSSGEMMACKEHLVGCERCQEILALLETTEDVPVALETAERDRPGHVRERVPVVPRAMQAKAGSLGDGESRPRELAPFMRLTASRAPAGNVPAPAVTKGGRRAAAYWLTPLGAIAAVLLMWVGMQTHTKNAARQEAVETAESRPTPQAAASPSFDSLTPDASAAVTDRKDAATKAAGRISAAAPQPQDELKRKALTEDAARGMSAPRAKMKDNAAVAAPSAETATGSMAAVEAAPPVLTSPVTSGGAGAVTNEQAQLQMNGRSLTQLNSGMEQQNAKKQIAPPAPAPAPAAADTLGQNIDGATSLMTLQAESVDAKKLAPLRASMVKTSPRLIPAPGGRVIWRVGKGGRIEQSRDAGATWSLQTSGVIADLETGSAPTDAVCWVAGSGETILVTVDGGGHWTKVSSPLAGEIAGVRAVDALNATVWDAGYKNTFVTSDGGVLWKRVGNK
jgi:hypothetical protein